VCPRARPSHKQLRAPPRGTQHQKSSVLPCHLLPKRLPAGSPRPGLCPRANPHFSLCFPTRARSAAPRPGASGRGPSARNRFISPRLHARHVCVGCGRAVCSLRCRCTGAGARLAARAPRPRRPPPRALPSGLRGHRHRRPLQLPRRAPRRRRLRRRLPRCAAALVLPLHRERCNAPARTRATVPRARGREATLASPPRGLATWSVCAPHIRRGEARSRPAADAPPVLADERARLSRSHGSTRRRS
jgi:hypothetical protein